MPFCQSVRCNVLSPMSLSILLSTLPQPPGLGYFMICCIVFLLLSFPCSHADKVLFWGIAWNLGTHQWQVTSLGHQLDIIWLDPVELIGSHRILRRLLIWNSQSTAIGMLQCNKKPASDEFSRIRSYQILRFLHCLLEPLGASQAQSHKVYVGWVSTHRNFRPSCDRVVLQWDALLGTRLLWCSCIVAVLLWWPPRLAWTAVVLLQYTSVLHHKGSFLSHHGQLVRADQHWGLDEGRTRALLASLTQCQTYIALISTKRRKHTATMRQDASSQCS